MRCQWTQLKSHKYSSDTTDTHDAHWARTQHGCRRQWKNRQHESERPVEKLPNFSIRDALKISTKLTEPAHTLILLCDDEEEWHALSPFLIAFHTHSIQAFFCVLSVVLHFPCMAQNEFLSHFLFFFGRFLDDTIRGHRPTLQKILGQFTLRPCVTQRAQRFFQITNKPTYHSRWFYVFWRVERWWLRCAKAKTKGK